MNEEKITPVTEDEIDNIRVTIELDDGGEVECRILTIFEVEELGPQDYIALMPLDENDEDNEDGEVYLYQYFEDEDGLPSLENIEDDEESEIVIQCFESIMNDELEEE